MLKKRLKLIIYIYKTQWIKVIKNGQMYDEMAWMETYTWYW